MSLLAFWFINNSSNDSFIQTPWWVHIHDMHVCGINSWMWSLWNDCIHCTVPLYIKDLSICPQWAPRDEDCTWSYALGQRPLIRILPILLGDFPCWSQCLICDYAMWKWFSTKTDGSLLSWPFFCCHSQKEPWTIPLLHKGASFSVS